MPYTRILLGGVLISMAGAAVAQNLPVPKLHAFPLTQVRLLEGRLLDEQERDRAYLHNLDMDRLLYNFRVNAGLPAPGEPYGGWEAPTSEVRGHFTGHYLSACALMYASTGDAELKARADTMVAELAKCQEALGGAYISAFPASFLDRVEAGQPVWAPYYTIHKILAGLYDAHTLCGNEQARDVVVRMADYLDQRTAKLASDVIDRMLRNEFGGMSEVLHNVYSVTGKPEHLALANRFDQPEFLGPLALSRDNLTRIHGNTQIPKIIGAARHYELTGDTRYRDLALFFWDRVVNTRTYATGGSTMFEHWPEPCKLADTLGHLNHETCKTFNMLKLTRHLLEWTGATAYGDFYERAFLNGILGTQGPRAGLLQYYVPMGAGYPRTYGTPDSAFWCCYGTGVETWGKLGDSIYFNDGTNLYVSLFVASTLDWAEKRLRLEQQTQFPDEDRTTITLALDKPAAFAVHLRAPYWLPGDPEILVNGAAADATRTPEGWIALAREWKNGDRIEARLPMGLHTMPLPDDPQQVAVLYGPLVLAGVIDVREGQDTIVDGFHEAVAAYRQSVRPSYFIGDPARPAEWLAPLYKKPLEFAPINQPCDLRLVPFARIMNERYVLYWPVVERDSPRHVELIAQNDRFDREIDRVFTFARLPEKAGSEREHNFQGEKTTPGLLLGTSWCYRHAEPGGWFSWDFKSDPARPAELVCTYWGSDVGRKFDILINGERIATQELNNLKPGGLTDIVYPIPEALTQGKERVTVRFEANHETMAGGVFGCAVLRRK